ncbi:MAG: dihydropteroate synthase [Moraxellaceae bacterium]|nr:dihydropteroate synthase [Pseudobdellovibrionaceae bacterium]
MQNSALTKRVVIGLGSNQEALINLRRALLELRRISQFKILKVSRIYESVAQLPVNAPLDWDQAYLNAAILIEVQNFDPLKLLDQLKVLEVRIGRVTTEKWAPRIIDLDILHVDDLRFKTENLTIPHPMLAQRPFAFLPALEVEPGMPLIRKNDQDYNTKISDRFFWPEFVGILNVTPDSFSDGGKYLERDNFLIQARKLVVAGADYLDIGAESTRPSAKPVSLVDELNRLKGALDHLEELRQEGFKFKISIDSRHYETILKVTENYKIDLINDVSGLTDDRILKLIKSQALSAVCMHSLSVPARKDLVLNSESNPVEQIQNWWLQKEKLFASHDIHEKNIFFDPGFGFGKTVEQNQYLVEHLEDFVKIQNKFFIGYSRKSFLGTATDRDMTTAQITHRINPAVSQLLRVHDIETQKSALRMPHAI